MKPMRSLLFASATLWLAATATGQTIGIDDLDPTTGVSNAFPFSVAGGQTSLHVYSAATLSALGVCPGAVLTDFQIAPSSGTGGVYIAPQARLQIGHLAVSPPVPGAWTTHLASPITLHDLTSGPYTFPWTVNTYTSLPGFATAGFVWDGVRDVGVLYTSSSGMTGGFNARRTATQLRHYVAIFDAQTQAPTSNVLFALEVRLTFAPGSGCASASQYGTGCYSPPLQLGSNLPRLGTNFVLTVSDVPNVVPLAILFFGDTQLPGPDLGSIGAPGCRGYTNANLGSASVPVVAGTGAATIPIGSSTALIGLTATTQAVAFTLANPLNLVTSNGVLWTIGS
jgi:hypothetical protein